ncbi:type I polyketide synthase [Coleofasciculus chthonoplastes]|nr:type I polyketide synthase [Coleofasciculus chthonoplastes]
MKFGLMFFASSEEALVGDKYSLLLESAKFADRHSFSSIWTPERHFTKFGSLYPNPAVLNAALARETRQIRLQAGSVVLPIHNPIRIAEEWAVVDNLSAGRVGLSFASGWNPNDFAFFPEKYQNRHQEMFSGIEMIRKLWRSESIQVTNGKGSQVEIRIYPTPIQPDLPIWITAASNPQTFIQAGEIGANLLTHLLDQDIDTLAEKITLYRQARAKQGHNPETGVVSIMLHTFVGQDFDAVREQVRVPYCHYLKSNFSLLKGLAQSRGSTIDPSTLSESDLDAFVNFLFEKYATARGLIGTPNTCLELLEKLDNIGVDEVACLLDFGPSKTLILDHLPSLNQLRERYNAEISAPKRSFVPTHPVQSLQSNSVTSARQNQPRSPNHDTLSDIRMRCSDRQNVQDYYQRLHQHGLQLGKAFQGIEQLWLGKAEALAQVKLDGTEINAQDSIQMNVALWETCHHVLLATLLKEGLLSNTSVLYLPMGLKTVQVYETISHEVWSYAYLSTVTDTLIEGDVRLFDQTGKLLVNISGLQLQPVEHQNYQTQDQDQYADWFYELQWQPQPLLKSSSSPIREPGSWLIFADLTGIGQALAQRLEAQGDICRLVYAAEEDAVAQEGQILLNPTEPEAMQALIEQMETLPPCRGVVHLWSLETTPPEATTLSSLDKDGTRSLTSTLHLIQALQRTNRSQLPQIWLVTQGAQRIGSEAVPPAIAQAPLWGVGRSLAMEIPQMWGGLIDLDHDVSPVNAANALFEQLWYPDQESQIALRCEQRYVPRLVPSPKQSIPKQPLSLQSDGTYLITGGLGHLGLNTARWLVENGARHIVLMGRGEASSTAQQAIRQLEALGVHVLVVKADVCNQADVVEVLEKINAYSPPLRGIFHAAGVAGFHRFSDMTPDLIQSILAAKVIGTWNLHQITLGLKLDFFVCISSITSLWGAEGLAYYAAANQFLDLIAHYRHHLHLPALTVNVGALAGGGMHYRHQGVTALREIVTQIGLKYYEPQLFLKTLESSLVRGVAQPIIVDIDWAIFKQLYEARERRTLLKEIEVKSPQPLVQPLGKLGQVLQQLKETSSSDRDEFLITYLQENVALVLKLKPSQLPSSEQNLTEIGMDSLTAMEFKNSIHQELGIDIPIVQFIGGTTIAALAAEINKQLIWVEKEGKIERRQDNQVNQTREQKSDWIEGEL